ncbi:MAG: FG-GAP-like repeat-containing protein, partial [Planctomycetales bacterium]
MLVRNWLEGFYRRLFPVGFGRLARNRRRQLRERRCTLHPTVAAWVDSLEERVLLATAASGEVLINSTVAGLQEFGAGSDRSFAVTPTGTLILAWGAADESSSEPAGEQGLGGTAFATTVAATTQVWARLVDVQGTPVGPQILVSDTPCLEAGNTVAGTAGSERFVVVWESTGNALDASGSGVFARLFSGDGTPLGNEFRVNLTTAGDQADPTVAWLSATSFVVGWSGAGTGDSQGVFTRVFDATGAPLTTEVQVNQQSEGVQKEPALVSLPNVGYQVAWSGAGPGDTEGIFSRPFDFTGQPLADAFRVNMLADGVQQSPALARTGSGATVLVAWQAPGEAGDTSDWGVFARQMRPTGTPVGDEFLVNQTTTGSQQNPVLVWFNEESFVVAWEGNGTGDADGVFRREFDLHNAPRIDEQLVNTTTAGVQHFPALRPYNLGYTVGWSGAGSGDDSGIFIQAFVPQNLAGWAFSPQGGTEAGRGRAELAAGNVVLREGDSFSVALSRGLVVPAAPSFVQFHFSDLQFDTTDATGINDAFEAALVDAHGDPLVHPLVVGRDASFNVTEGEPLAKSASVLLAGQTVQFDLSHLSPGTAARLVVRLVNNDRDVNTSVVVSPFEVLPGSLGTPLGIPPESNAALSSLPSRRFEQLTDVTGSVRMDYGRTTLSENPEDLATEVLLTNLGTTALHGSVLAVFDRFSDPAVSLVGPSGFLPDGRPYLDLTAFVPDGDLIQGEATGRAPLVFRNPNGAQFTYGITILAELNRSPTGFDSTPVREIASGTDYRYSAVASDPDQQALSYTLVIGPQGMAIDPATGLVTWPTQTADVGSHSITLRATDPYGQFVEQSFDLVVSATLLNRPPIFTSAPPTDAVVASPFEVLTYATGGAPAAVTAGIFGSGSVSVVTANPGDQTLGLLGGAEQGRLQPTQPLNVGEPPPAALPTAIVAPIPVDLGFSPNTYQNIERDLGVETADVNADGIPDLIAVVVTGSENYFSTASVGYVGIRLGNGDGTFRPGWQATLPAVANRSSAASEVLFADVTSDSKPDLVLAQYVGNRLLVYAGNGDGTFAPTPITSPWVGSASLMQLADFNGDGELDAAMFENNASGQFRSGIAVLMGDGAGSFGAETFYPAANDNQFAGYAIDVDGVNGPDLVRVSYVDQALIVRLNDGQGAFGAALFSTVYAIGNNGLDPLAHFVTNPISAYFGDFDHDGKIDAEVSTATLGLFFLRGTGDGHFGDGTAGGNRANIPIFQPTGFDNFPSAYHGDGLARDFNGDGELDVIFGNGASAQLFIGLGRGDGTFAQSFYNAQYTPDIGTGSVRGDTNTSTVNVADYNLDGVMDVLVVSHRNPYRPGGAAVVLGDRAGTLRAAHVVPANDSGIGPPFVTADFDNDGIPDVAAISNSIAVSLGRGDGTFAPFELGIHVPAGGGEVLAGSLITRDFDGDGNMDLAWVGLDSVQGGAP